MPSQFDKPFASIFVFCEDLYRTNKAHAATPREKGTLIDMISDALTQTLSSLAGLHQVLYPGWYADKDHPGYLVKLDPPMFLRVPYHALSVFPNGNDLDAVWEVSRRIRSAESSLICLSGSNVLKRIFEVVGDLDFCEYFILRQQNDVGRLVENTKLEHPVCLRASFGDQKWAYPWTEGRPSESVLVNMNSKSADLSSLKYDYVGLVEPAGAIDISNVILVCDADRRSASMGKTFAAQEAHLTPALTLPNQMNDPFEMGRYVNWLTGEIDKYRSSNPLKALKRTASLARVMFVSNVTDQIAELVQSSSILLERKLDDLQKLKVTIQPISSTEQGQAIVARVESDIKHLQAELKNRTSDQRKFNETSIQIIDELLRYFSRPALAA